MKNLQELLSLGGKAAIVTGGAKGIGYGIAYRLAEAGAKVLIADLDEAGAQQSVDKLAQKGWAVRAIRTDVSNEQDVANLVSECQSTFGSVDILVNNAGIYPNQPIAGMSKEDFDKVMNVNLRSAFLTTKYASAAMKQAGHGGRIINITSIDALHPSMVGLAHYDASKHGMWGFTKNSALELAEYKIWVNAIAPGGIQTPGVAAMQSGQLAQPGMNPQAAIEAFLAKIPMHRLGEPDEIGMVALFLASDMASYMTGSQIVVDGGALLK
ncbi:MAG TPA: SDR family NAD(P)-dependent oxidoreductase [Candidatus Saccharimonadales bacterium]|nr:SDR family NAD(P)-dependent oxidoreductase [Candidatus Saccharimonadales bacterium]